MCDQRRTGEKSQMDDFIDNETFKSYYARSVVVNSQYKQTKERNSEKSQTGENCVDGNKDVCSNQPPDSKTLQDSPVRFRKNNRSASMDDSRRYSCGSILSRRSSLVVTHQKRNEIPVENIYNQKKIEGLQWQLRETERSRGMYRDLMKQIVIFLEKAHVSLEHLGHRLNRKNSVSRSKSEHHVDASTQNATLSQKALIEEHLSSWTTNNKPELHPEEVPPQKLSQEAFRLLRTAQSLLNTQEPNLTTSDTSNIPEEPSDLEFLAQVAKEFPSEGRSFYKPTSFSLSPKLILPENDLKICTAFNRKLSLQLGDVKRNSKCDVNRASVAEIECYSLPPGVDKGGNLDPLRPLECLDGRAKNLDKAPGSPATASISSTEDESGFSSMNSFQDVGLPLVNSTGIDEVSARSVLLKSMIHNNDYGSLGIDSDQYNSVLDSTVTSTSPFTYRRSIRRSNAVKQNAATVEDFKRHSLSDVKLWQRPPTSESEIRKSSAEETSFANAAINIDSSSPGNHKRWNSTPEPKNDSSALKVLWV